MEEWFSLFLRRWKKFIDDCMVHSIVADSLELVNYFEEQGFENWDLAFRTAVGLGRWKIVDRIQNTRKSYVASVLVDEISK